jgi:4-hydroxy-2-oxoglutarate aldolase
MTSYKDKLSGVFAPVVTPFQNDKLLLDDLAYNLNKLQNSQLTGYLALGSNGEYKSLNDNEQQQVLEIFAREKGQKTVMVGTGAESTKETIEKSKLAATLGFEFVSVLTPHYFAKKMDSKTLIAYYTTIADQIDIPLLIYNAPGFAAGVQLAPEAVIELAQHPNIIGMKDSSSAGPARFLSRLDSQASFYILAGSTNFFYPSLHLGATGGVLSLANAFPDLCCQLYHHFKKGAYEKARHLHSRLSRLNAAVSGRHGVAGVKAAMTLAGFKAGTPRHPIQPLSQAEIDKLGNCLLHEGINLEH